MSIQTESRDVRNCRLFSHAASVIAALVGSLALLGWLLQVSALTTILPGLPSMKPNTALCFVLEGVALWLIQLRPGELNSPRVQHIHAARVLSGIVGLVGLLTLAEYFFHLDLGIGEVLFNQTLQSTGILHPGRMAGATAVGFALLGGSVLLMSNRRPYPAQGLALLASLSGFVACVGYLLGIRSLYDTPAYSSMALNTAILFVVVGMAILAARPRLGVMAAVTSEHMGGVMARRVLPLVVAVPILFGWLRWHGQLAGLYGTEFGIALRTLGEVVTFATLLWLSAVWLNRADQERREVQRRNYDLASIVASSDDAMLSLDLSATIISWNRGAEELFGYGAAEIIGHPVATIIPPDLQEEAEEFLREVSEGRVAARDQTVRRHKDGSLVYVSLVVSPVRDFEGQIVGSAAVAHDISERMRAQEARERLAAIVDSSDDAIISKTLNGTISNWNSGAEKLFGYASSEVVGKPILILVPPERASEEADILARISRGQSVEHFETVRIRKDGSPVDVSVTISPIRDSSGAIVGASKIARDITERKQAEQRLRESEENYRTLFESMDEGFCTIEVLLNEDNKPVDYRFLDVNPAFEKQTGISNAQGRTMREIAPQHEEHWFEIYGKIALTGEPARFENVAAQLHRCYDVHAFRVGDPEARKVAVFFDDITHRKQAEEALHTSEERFSKAFRGSPVAITIATAAEGRYLDVNDAFLNMVGHKRAEVIGRTSLDIDLWVDKSQRFEMLRQLREGGRVTELRMQHKTSAGEILETEVSADLIELEGQACVLAIMRDITETLRLEAQFRQAQKMEAVGRLAGGVAHDFNNMLGVIIGYSDLALTMIAPESPVNRHLEQIKKASHKAVGLTRQLLAFSRQQVVFPKILDLNEVVQNVTTMLQRLVGEDIAMSFRPAVPLDSINADPGQVEQILMNLVVNARDAMPGGGEIIIETGHAELDEHYVSQHPGSHAGQHVLLAVSDTGCGIDENIKSKIFEPFFTTKGIGQGTGLGLSTVYGIVKQGGGTIFVYSEPGKGTTFKIYFPRVAGKAEHLAQPHEEAEFPGGSETILVVEDDFALRELTVHMLQDAGYRVVEASNAEVALDIMKASNPEIDLLLTDVVMPGKSGVELLEQAKVIRPNLCSLFVSGYTGDLALRGGLVPEAAFLEKPFTRNSLLKKVRSALHTG